MAILMSKGGGTVVIIIVIKQSNLTGTKARQQCLNEGKSPDRLDAPTLSQGNESQFSTKGAGTTQDSQLAYPVGGLGFSVDENARYQYFGIKYVSEAFDPIEEDYSNVQFFEIPVWLAVDEVDGPARWGVEDSFYSFDDYHKGLVDACAEEWAEAFYDYADVLCY